MGSSAQMLTGVQLQSDWRSRFLTALLWRLGSTLGGVVLLGLLLTGCLRDPAADTAPLGASVTSVPLPAGTVARSVAWLDSGLVVAVQPESGATALTSRLWHLHPDGAEATPVALPLHPGCAAQSLLAPSRLPDGRLGYLAQCFPTVGAFPSGVFLMAHDPTTGSTMDLLPYPLQRIGTGKGGYALNPAMTRGLTDDGEGLKEQLFWFGADGKVAWDTGMYRAYGASWSPDGQQLAFLGASPQGRSGLASADAVFTLYLRAASGGELRPLMAGIRYGGATAWSLDGRWLAVPCEIEARRGHGLWLVEVATGRHELIATGDLTGPAWSPDGTRLAAVEWIATPGRRTQRLLVIDPGPLLRQPEGGTAAELRAAS